MSQVRADSKGPSATIDRPRPLSPHLQVWRWHVTLAASISTRITGMALYVGLIIVAGLALSLAAGPDAYATYTRLLGSPIGLIVLFGLTVSIFYHLAGGVRHLFWDYGLGFKPSMANRTAWAAYGFAILASVIVWVAAFMVGA